MSDNKTVIIQPGEYPVLTGAAVAELKKALKSSLVGLAAAKALADNVAPMRAAVVAAIPALEAAGTDAAKVYAAAHEIRGLAGNADLKAAAQIAAVLCLYLDRIMRAGQEADPALIRLHVAAITRAARAIDADSQFSLHVAKELVMLVNAKLADIPG